jgi:hypothetical protein
VNETNLGISVCRIGDFEHGRERYTARREFSHRQRKALYIAWIDMRFVAVAAQRTGQTNVARRMAAACRELVAQFSDRGQLRNERFLATGGFPRTERRL